jgi:hypothetical protein
VIVSKTTPLKLSTQNLKNVELISASSLNTLSIKKAANYFNTIGNRLYKGDLL